MAESARAILPGEPPPQSIPPKQLEFGRIPLESIQPSSTNPRKDFADPEFDADIKARGVKIAILVRPMPGRPGAYELIAGERRFRSAQKAGHKDIPARIEVMTDQEAREAQLVENLQRKDLQALEEAQGYRDLLEAMAKTQPQAKREDLVKQLAGRVNKAPRSVYAAMQRLDLIPEIQEALRAGRITPSHGDLLVRLDKERQEEVVRDSLFEYDSKTGEYGGAAVSVRELKSCIENSSQELKRAAWKWQKDTSVAPPCIACEKNTANQEGGDPKHARCLDEQ